jgi:hypothetical protein
MTNSSRPQWTLPFQMTTTLRTLVHSVNMLQRNTPHSSPYRWRVSGMGKWHHLCHRITLTIPIFSQPWAEHHFLKYPMPIRRQVETATNRQTHKISRHQTQIILRTIPPETPSIPPMAAITITIWNPTISITLGQDKLPRFSRL